LKKVDASLGERGGSVGSSIKGCKTRITLLITEITKMKRREHRVPTFRVRDGMYDIFRLGPSE